MANLLSRRHLLSLAAAPFWPSRSTADIAPDKPHRGESWDAWAGLLADMEHAAVRSPGYGLGGYGPGLRDVTLVEFCPRVFCWVGVGPVDAATRDYDRHVSAHLPDVVTLGRAMNGDRTAWCVFVTSRRTKAELRHSMEGRHG